MLRTAYKQKGQHQVLFEDKLKHECIVRKNDNGNEL